MPSSTRLSASLAVAACVGMVGTPAAAVSFPRADPVGAARIIYDGEAETVWHGRRWRDRDRGIGAGDVIAGVLILGGIAAVASAAGRSRDPVERYPSRYPYPEDPRYREQERGWESDGLDRAVDMCVAEIERDRARVAAVDTASRGVDGWFVAGEIEGRVPFTCRIDNNGRIDEIDIGGALVSHASDTDDGWYGDDAYDDRSYGDVQDGSSGAASAEWAADGQYPDDVYRRARADAAADPGF